MPLKTEIRNTNQYWTWIIYGPTLWYRWFFDTMHIYVSTYYFNQFSHFSFCLIISSLVCRLLNFFRFLMHSQHNVIINRRRLHTFVNLCLLFYLINQILFVSLIKWNNYKLNQFSPSFLNFKNHCTIKPPIYIFIYELYYGGKMKQWWSTITWISTKRSPSSHLKLLNTRKKITTYMPMDL